MADMIESDMAHQFYEKIDGRCDREIIPVVYMNCYADMKSFCGEKGGAVCTSSNAAKILQYYFDKGKAVFFSPDYNLGINTARQLGIPDEQIVKVKKDLTFETTGDIKNAKLFLWDGFCHVHKVFSVEDCKKWREEHPDINIIVHPECNEDVVREADLFGSTQQIFNTIKNAPKGSKWAIGTEYNFVIRLAKDYPDLTIVPLRDSVCYNMQKITLELLADSLKSISDYQEGKGQLKFDVIVSEDYKENSKKALQKMIEIVEAGY